MTMNIALQDLTPLTWSLCVFLKKGERVVGSALRKKREFFVHKNRRVVVVQPLNND